MKHTFKLFGIIAIAAIIGFSFIACDDDIAVDTSINGNWINSEAGVKMSLNNGTIIQSMEPEEGQGYVEAIRGNYTTNEGKITINFTHIKGSIVGEAGAMFGIDPGKWYTPQQLITTITDALLALGMPQEQIDAMITDGMEGFDHLLEPMTYDYVLDGNNLTVIMDEEPIIFTRV